MLAAIWLGVDFLCVAQAYGYQERSLIGLLFLAVAAHWSPADRPLSTSDLRRDLRVLGKVLLWGGLAELLIVLGLGVWIFALGNEFELAGTMSHAEVWRFWFLTLLTAPFIEELLFRGLLQRQLEVGLGRTAAILISGPIFWVYHWIAFGGITPINHMVAGWILAWVYAKTGNLWVAIALHAIGNLSVLLLQSLQVAVS